MSLRLASRRPIPGRRWLAAVPVLAAGMIAAGPSSAMAACTNAGTGAVAQFCSQPASTTAGSDPAISSAIDFQYSGSTTDSVKDLTVTLPPGLLAEPRNVGATCTAAELSSSSCPAASEIGTGTVTASGATVNSTLYLMPAPATGDVAGLGLSVAGATPVTGAADVVTTGGQPALQLSFKNIPNSFGGLAVQVTALTLQINGTTSSGAAFTRLPTSGSAATTSLSADTYSGATGSGSDSFTPTGAGSLAYAPTLTAQATRDASDAGVQLVTTVTQAATEAASQDITLVVPQSVLGPNLSAALQDFGKQVGTATATTALLSSPLTGTVTLTGSASAPALTIAFPPPVAFSVSGAVNLANNSVSFSSLPDVPLTNLTVTLSGGPNALFTSSCATPSGTLSGSFTGQNGTTKSDSAPLTVSGCPAPGGSTPPPPPILGGGALSGLAGGHPQLSFTLAAGSGAPKVASFTLALPHGLSFTAKGLAKGVKVSGAKVRSVKLRHGRLVVTLRSAASKLRVKVTTKALKVSKSLSRQAKRHKLKSLSAKIAVKDASGRTTNLKLVISRVH